jgi:hypothetical protein
MKLATHLLYHAVHKSAPQLSRVIFCNLLASYGVGMLATQPNPELDNHLLSHEVNYGRAEFVMNIAEW